MRFGKLYIRIFGYGLMMSCLSSVSAGKEGYEYAEEAKKVVEKELKSEQRHKNKTRVELDEERKEIIERLESLQRRYEEKESHGEVRAIAAQIRLIRKRLGKLKKGAKFKEKPADQNLAMFLYNRNYIFSSSVIKGSLRFGRNGMVKVNYEKGKKKYRSHWKFTLHDDHLEILGDGQLGKIYLSEIPSKQPKALMVRWGGELLHELSIAETK